MVDKRKKKTPFKPERGAVRKGKQSSYTVPEDQDEPEGNVEGEQRGRDAFSGDETP